jgi:hypothetical protein
MGQKGPVLRPRFIGPGRGRTHIPFNSFQIMRKVVYSVRCCVIPNNSSLLNMTSYSSISWRNNRVLLQLDAMDAPVLQTNLMEITDHASVTYGLEKFFFATTSKPALQLTLQPIHFRVQWTLGVNFKKVNGPALEATMTSIWCRD